MFTPSPPKIERAIRFSYAQAMFGSIYAASTGGMFLIGFALRLGANNVQIGLMSTVPMFCVLAQLLSAWLLERGASRRRMTMLAALVSVSTWVLAILIPFAIPGASSAVKVGALIATVTLVTLFAHIQGNARASWVGDLIPADSRATFFGRMVMFGGIIGTVFALVEGTFLDHVKRMGTGAFSGLFAFGMLFGLINSLCFIPQPDIPLAKHEDNPRFGQLVRQTFSNRPLMVLMVYSLLWSMQAIAVPFYATYMLRDLRMPFLGVGIVNSVAAMTLLVASPFWGRVVDRYGCRPVLVTCTLAVAPLTLVWLWMTSPMAVYLAVIPVNLLVGLAVSGISVSLNTLVYKLTPNVGRSAQLAAYSVMVVLGASFMPTLGGHLPSWLTAAGIPADLRYTFYASMVFIFAAGWAARYIKETDSSEIGELVRNLPGHLRSVKSLQD